MSEYFDNMKLLNKLKKLRNCQMNGWEVFGSKGFVQSCGNDQLIKTNEPCNFNTSEDISRDNDREMK